MPILVVFITLRFQTFKKIFLYIVSLRESYFCHICSKLIEIFATSSEYKGRAVSIGSS